MTGYLMVGAPALAALIGLPAGRRSRAMAVAIGVAGAVVALLAAISGVVATWPKSGSGGAISANLLGALDLGSRTVTLEWSIAGWQALVCVAVTLVALGVQVYSSGYLVPHTGEGERPAPPRYAPYAATVSLFTAAMLVVVGADDLLLLLLGWEVMGVCSYLLIGHHSERNAARRAALQAFLVTRVADIGFVVGIAALYAAAGTTNIGAILAQADTLPPANVTVAVVGLAFGVFGKSAQFPFHGWLPDAMEGPTPVSALIHAATMVAAGVVVLVRVGPLLDRSTTALALVAVISCVSMLGAALAALVSDDLKRVLAWSTVSQVAVMLAALSLASAAGRAGAIMLLLAHAAFKALLFLTAGAISARFGTTRLADLADLWRRDQRLTVLLGIGLLGLAGVPPLAGFVGKEGILTAAENALGARGAVGWLVLVCLGVTTLLTAGYSARLFAALTRYDLPPPVMAHAEAGARPHPTAQPTPAEPAPAVQPVPLPVGHDPVEHGPVEHGPGPQFVPPDELGAPQHPTSQHSAPDQSTAEHSLGHQPTVYRAPTPPESLSFVDRRGEYQDWDLIAGLDSDRPPPWTAEGRAARVEQARQARRRLEAGHNDSRTRRLAARAPYERPSRLSLGPQADGSSPLDPARRSSAPSDDRTGSRLARAVSGQRAADPHPPLNPTTPLRSRLAPAPPRPARPVGPEPEPVPGRPLPAAMTGPLWVLAVGTLVVGVVPFVGGLDGYELGLLTAVIGTVLAVAGAALGFRRGPAGERDPAMRVPPRWRAVAAGGFGYQWAQHRLVVRPVTAVARLAAGGDEAVIGTWLSLPAALPWFGSIVRRAQSGNVTSYLSWVGAAAVALGVAVVVGLRIGG